MKKKLITLLLSSVICVNFSACAGCGSPETETVATVDTETETEIETEVVETETTTEESTEGLEATDTLSESDPLKEKDYPETYMQFTDIEPKTLYAIQDDTMWGNPNKYDGQLIADGTLNKGSQYTVNGTGDYEGKSYYRLENNKNWVFIIEQSLLAEEMPTEPETSPADTDNSNDNASNTNNSTPQTNDPTFEALLQEEQAAGTMADIPQAEQYDTSTFSDEALDAADGMFIQ